MASRKIVLVTGGNNGIGYEAVKALLQSSKAYHVLMGSRSLEKGKKAIETLHEECPKATNTVEMVQVDLTSDQSIEKAFEQVKASSGHIDTLINNAGMQTFLPLCPITFHVRTKISQAPPLISSSSAARSHSATASPNPTTSTSPARRS